MSAPGALYTMVQAVPGFLQRSELLAWGTTYVVGLVTALLTLGVLPMCAGMFGNVHRDVSMLDLLSVGKILTAILVPAVATVACHENCLGMWVLFWAPCQRHRHPGSHVLDINALDEMHINLGDTEGFVPQPLVSSKELCSVHTSLQPRRCVHSLIERNSRLLLKSLLHMIWAYPVAHFTTGWKMKLGTAWVLLVFVWEVLLVSGALVPLIALPLTAIVAVHGVVLFDHRGLTDDDTSVVLPHPSLTLAWISSVLLQLGTTSESLATSLLLLLLAIPH
eukprot:531649-Amphidinium_carterae.1